MNELFKQLVELTLSELFASYLLVGCFGMIVGLLVAIGQSKIKEH